MIQNLVDCFEPKHEFYLNSIDFKRIDDQVANISKIQANFADTIDAQRIDENTVRVLVERAMSFEPAVFYSLSISFGANLKILPEKKDTIKWDEINLSQEFLDCGNFVTTNLANRISLLLGEITASYGLGPIITPPQVIGSRG